MSKGSLFWANAKGKLGETVFYRAGGEQRNRTYVKNIKNPKTLAQAEQRLSMLNLVSGFRALSPLLRHSFPNRPSNQSGFNAFVQANKSAATPFIDALGAEKGLAVLGQAVISKGNLVLGGGLELKRDLFTDSTQPSSPARDGIGFVLPLPASVQVEGSPEAEAWATAIQLGANEKSAPIASGAHFAALLKVLGLSMNAVFNIVVGEYADEGFSYGTFTVTKDSDVIRLPWSDITLVVASTSDASLEDKPAEIFVGLDIARKDSDEVYGSIVVSDKVQDKVDVTTSRLMTTATDTEYTKQFEKGGFVYEQIMANYAPSKGSILEV